MRTTFAVCMAIGSLFAVASSIAHAAPFIFEYEARAATVVGSPLGLTIPPNQIVTGTFTYETTTPDTNASAQRGDYPHAAVIGFAVFGRGVTCRTDR